MKCHAKILIDGAPEAEVFGDSEDVIFVGMVQSYVARYINQFNDRCVIEIKEDR